MNKLLPFLTLALLLSLLTACGDDSYQRAYIAAGEGTVEKDLTADEQFTPTEDINVVIKLGRRDRTLNLGARFIDPNGDILEEITAQAPSRVGTVVMGLDYQSRDDVAQGGGWRSGRYKVEIRIDEELVETLYFRVD